MLRDLFYDFLKFMTRQTFRVYFRRWAYHFSYPIPKNASIIFAANHQNAFMDAIALIDTQSKRPTWLTRAAMFKTAIARFWLHVLYMIPIYRTRDGIRNVSKNQEIIEKCIQLLIDEKKPIGIFPEGNHHINMTLRSPLQKGIARIAFDTASRTDDPSNLYIVPVGFSYSDGMKFRSNLFIHYGEPICVGDYYEDWKENPARTIRELLKEISKRLSQQMIDIKADNYYETLDTWRKYKKTYSSLYEEFKEDKKLIGEIESGTMNREIPKKGSGLLLKILGFPFYILGYLTNLPIWLIFVYMESRVIQDPHFYSSIRCFGGMAIVPIVYAIQGTLFHQFTGHNWIWTLCFLVVSFLSGIIAGDYHYSFIASKADVKKIPLPHESE